MPTKIKYINNEVKYISGLNFDDSRVSKNGIYCPRFTASNIERIHNYVVNESSYSNDSGDNFVKKYFQEHCGDTTTASIITKIILIDTVDSTNLKQQLGKDYYKIIAKRIIEYNLEDIIKTGGKFGETFKKVASFNPKKGYKKEDMNLFVFFSKYITRVNQYCYGRDDYSILDKVVKDNLKHFNDSEINIPDIEELRINYDYDGYCDVFKAVLDKFPNITRQMIDHFVWFTFKEEAVGDK
ncbi:MAG: hypothetical protein E7513_05025 [Ruminococcaceae bacterium]|nr:hypothetical protein [Oscillospiraceae bacterium]